MGKHATKTAIRLSATGVFLLLALAMPPATKTAEPVTDLTPLRLRLSDETIAIDLRAIADWQSRLASAHQHGLVRSQYAAAKAAAWLRLAWVEYTDNDQTGVAEDAFREAVFLIQSLERGETRFAGETRMPRGSKRLREDLWQLARSLQEHPGFPCVETEIAWLEVQLVWAGNEALDCGDCASRPHLLEAEKLAALARRKVDSCGSEDSAPLPPEDTAPVPPPLPMAEPAPHVELSPQMLGVPNVVFFALDRVDISPATAKVLDHVVAVLRQQPQIEVYVEGHADVRGSDGYNLMLSRFRTDAVSAYLVRAGIDAERIKTAHRGKSWPYSKGRTRRDHGLNRRVEFRFFGVGDVDLRPTRQETDLQIEPPK